MSLYRGIITSFSVWTNYISSIYKITCCNTHTEITWKERHIAIIRSSKNSREILHSRTVLGIVDINNGSRDLQAGYQRNSDCLHVWLISRYNLLVNFTWRIVFGNKNCVLNYLRYKQTYNSLIKNLFLSPDADFILYSSNANKYQIVKDNSTLYDSFVKEIFCAQGNMENMQGMEHMIREYTSYVRSRRTSSSM